MEGKVCNVSGNKALAVNRLLTEAEVWSLTYVLDEIISDPSRFDIPKFRINEVRKIRNYIRWNNEEKAFSRLVESIKRGSFPYKKYTKGYGKWEKFSVAVSESDKGYTVFSPYGESFVYGIYKDKETGRVSIETRYQEGENRKPFNVE